MVGGFEQLMIWFCFVQRFWLSSFWTSAPTSNLEMTTVASMRNLTWALCRIWNECIVADEMNVLRSSEVWGKVLLLKKRRSVTGGSNPYSSPDMAGGCQRSWSRGWTYAIRCQFIKVRSVPTKSTANCRRHWGWSFPEAQRLNGRSTGHRAWLAVPWRLPCIKLYPVDLNLVGLVPACFHLILLWRVPLREFIEQGNQAWWQLCHEKYPFSFFVIIDYEIRLLRVCEADQIALCH